MRTNKMTNVTALHSEVSIVETFIGQMSHSYRTKVRLTIPKKAKELALKEDFRTYVNDLGDMKFQIERVIKTRPQKTPVIRPNGPSEKTFFVHIPETDAKVIPEFGTEKIKIHFMSDGTLITEAPLMNVQPRHRATKVEEFSVADIKEDVIGKIDEHISEIKKLLERL